jgi:hypothetical protein
MRRTKVVSFFCDNRPNMSHTDTRIIDDSHIPHTHPDTEILLLSIEKKSLVKPSYPLKITPTHHECST